MIYTLIILAVAVAALKIEIMLTRKQINENFEFNKSCTESLRAVVTKNISDSASSFRVKRLEEHSQLHNKSIKKLDAAVNELKNEGILKDARIQGNTITSLRYVTLIEELETELRELFISTEQHAAQIKETDVAFEHYVTLATEEMAESRAHITRCATLIKELAGGE